MTKTEKRGLFGVVFIFVFIGTVLVVTVPSRPSSSSDGFKGRQESAKKEATAKAIEEPTKEKKPKEIVITPPTPEMSLEEAWSHLESAFNKCAGLPATKFDWSKDDNPSINDPTRATTVAVWFSKKTGVLKRLHVKHAPGGTTITRYMDTGARVVPVQLELEPKCDRACLRCTRNLLKKALSIPRKHSASNCKGSTCSLVSVHIYPTAEGFYGE
jgi:hypothetical protein